MSIATSFAPLVASIIGGYMEDYYGWRGSFAVYAIIVSIGICIFSLFFSDSEKKATSNKNIFSIYKKLIFNIQFVRLIALQGLALSILHTYKAIAPFLVQTEMGKSPIYFGWLTAFCAICQLSTKLFSPKLIRQYSTYNVHQSGWILLLVSGSLLLFRLIFPYEKLFIIGIGSAFFSIYLIFPFIISEAFNLPGLKSGAVGSGLTAFGTLFCFFLSSLVASIPSEGTGVLATTYITLSLTGIFIARKVQHLN